jgi:hypothetical protein
VVLYVFLSPKCLLIVSLMQTLLNRRGYALNFCGRHATLALNSSNQLVTSTSLACVAAKLLHDGLVFSAIVDFDVVVAIEH